LFVTFEETSYLNTDMRKFDSSQKEKSGPSLLIPRKLTVNVKLLIVPGQLL